MTTETINGLHSCKPGNEPQIGQIKSFVVQHMTSKNGKPYLKIKSANAENGGTPHRILQAEPTGFTDSYGNVSFNIEIEPAVKGGEVYKSSNVAVDEQPTMPPQRHVSEVTLKSDGVQETREHLMQSANLYNLCVQAVDKAVAPHVPAVAQTSEQFQAAVASLFIEASRRITDDGVNWHSYVNKMPIKPIDRSEPKEYQPESF